MIICKNIYKSYGEKSVLENIDYNIEERGIFSIIGPSGCGKTTLSRIIMKLEKESSGEIIYNKKIGFSAVFPEDRLIPNLDAFNNIDYVLKNRKKTDRLLKIVELYDDRYKYPIELSNGMKRRVSIARALGYESELLVLDEPYNGLEQRLKEKFTDIFIEESKKRAVLLMDHNTDLVNSISNNILDLSNKGK